MKFTIEAATLLDGLKSIHARTKSNAQAAEILKHISFTVSGASLTLLGHDQSSSSEATLQVDSPSDGTCAVPSESIVRLIGSLPKEAHVTIEQDGTIITVKSGRSRYKIPVLVIDNFPGPLPCEDGVTVELSSDDVIQLFKRPLVALDPKDTRAWGQGVYLHAVDGILCSCAISLFHFARYSTVVRCPELSGVIVPAAAIEEISKLGAGKLTISERSIAYEIDGRRYCSKLIDSKFPDYPRVLPSLSDNYVDIDRDEMLAAVRRLTSVAAPDSVIDLNFGDCEITASLSGICDGVETIQCSGQVKAFLSVAAHKLVEMLEMPKGETLQFHTYGRKTAFRLHDPSETASIFVEATRIPKGNQQGMAA